MINIVIGGDVCPIGRNLPFFVKGNAKGIFNDLLPEFEKADLSIINLECPLINEKTPISKNGPVLGVESDCINGLKEAKIDVLNLANNHIMDHGAKGMENTLRVCAEAGFSTVGAGENLREARRILIKRVGKMRIGILAVAEHEFSIATENNWGANPLDLIDFVRNVREARENYDHLVVLLHGGNEHYPYPSPRLRDTCRFMVEMGANAVIVQHTHCPGSYEEYRNGHIVYGQGNLIFDWPDADVAFYEGFLVRLSITEDINTTMNLIPYKQSVPLTGVRKMDKDAEMTLMEVLRERSLRIKDDAFVMTQWLNFCQTRKYSYLNRLFGYNRLLSRLNRNGFVGNNFYSAKSYSRIQNSIACESHREVLETIFSHQLI